MSQSLRRLAWLLGLAAVYYFGAKLGLRFAYINSSVTTIWPPAGIALAAFVLFGYRVWPAIFGAAFLANFTTTGAVLPSLGIAIGNTIEGLLAAYLVNRFARGDEPRAVGGRDIAARYSGNVARARGHRSADRTRESPAADPGARVRDQALAPHRPAAGGGPARPGRPEADQRPPRPPGRQPGDSPGRRGAAGIVPRDRYGGAVRRRRVRARAPRDGGSGRLARGAWRRGAAGDGCREAQYLHQRGGSSVPRPR